MPHPFQALIPQPQAQAPNHLLWDIGSLIAVSTSQTKLIIFGLNLLLLPPLHLFYTLTTKNYLFPISFNTIPIHSVYQGGTLSAVAPSLGYIQKYLHLSPTGSNSDLIGLRCGLGIGGGEA